MFPTTSGASALTNFVRTLRDRKKIALTCVTRLQKFSSMNTSHETESLKIGAHFTAEQQDVILNKINNCSVDELKRYRITEARIKKLTAYRDRYGSFKSLSDILLMQGIDIGVLDRFCKSIIKGQEPPKQPKTSSSRSVPLTPPLGNEVRTSLTTVTGIRVSGSVISWAQVDTSCNLLFWECDSVEEATLKDGLVATVEAVAGVVSKVPPSHAYIMESDPIVPFTRINSVAYYLQLQRQQIVSTIVSLLGSRERRFGETLETRTLINNIYMMQSRAVSKRFKLLIGSEEVSAQSVVREILRGEDTDKIHIRADPGAQEIYRMQNDYEREQMNWALLLTATFLDMLIRDKSKKA